MREENSLDKEANRVFNPRRKLRRTIYLLPSLFTVGNLFAGFFAVVATLSGNFEQAAIAIGIAIVLDGIDGHVARLADAASDFGLQLDSLADVISFGLAPAILLYSWGLAELGDFARFSAFVFVVCGAMRLARFNIQVQNLKSFAGLPIPAGAGMIAATVHLFGATPPQSDLFRFCLVAMVYGLAFLMISTLRYPSLKHLNLSREKSHLNILMLALLVAGVIWYSKLFLMLIGGGYVMSGLLHRAFQIIKFRVKRDSSLADQPE